MKKRKRGSEYIKGSDIIVSDPILAVLVKEMLSKFEKGLEWLQLFPLILLSSYNYHDHVPLNSKSSATCDLFDHTSNKQKLVMVLLSSENLLLRLYSKHNTCDLHIEIELKRDNLSFGDISFAAASLLPFISPPPLNNDRNLNSTQTYAERQQKTY